MSTTKTFLNCFLLLLFTGTTFISKAQKPSPQPLPDSLVFYDVTVVLSKNSEDKPFKRGDKPQPITGLKLTVFFKVNQPANIAELYFGLGVQQNGTEFKNETISLNPPDKTGTVIMKSGKTQVGRFYSNASIYETVVPIEKLQSVKWLTMYTKDRMGNYSAKKYLKIQKDAVK